MGTALPRKTTPLEVYGQSHVEIFGGFAQNGAGNPTSVIGGPFIKSIVRTGVGTFTVTIDGSFRPKDLIGVAAEYVNVAASPGLASIAFGPYAIGANGADTTVTMYTLTSSALADHAANAANKVRFSLRFKNTPIKDPTGL